MALTKILEPQDLTPVYNDVVYIIDSDNKNNNGFVYIIDIFVYVDNVRTKLIRKKILPRPGDKLLELNITRILQNYVTYTKPFTQSPIDSVDSYVFYDIDVYESYIPQTELTSIDVDDSFPYIVTLNVDNTAGLEVGDIIEVTMDENEPIIGFFEGGLIIQQKTANSFIFNNLTDINIINEIQDYQSVNSTGGTGIVNKVGGFTFLFEDSLLTTDKLLAWNGALKHNNFILPDSSSVTDNPDYYISSKYLIDNTEALALTSMKPNYLQNMLDGHLKLKPWQTAYINFWEEEETDFYIKAFYNDGSTHTRYIENEYSTIGNRVNGFVLSPQYIANGSIFEIDNNSVNTLFNGVYSNVGGNVSITVDSILPEFEIGGFVQIVPEFSNPSMPSINNPIEILNIVGTNLVLDLNFTIFDDELEGYESINGNIEANVYPILEEDDFITDDTIRIEVNRGNGNTSGTYIFDIDNSCSNNDEYEVLFLDKLGSMFSFVFDGESGNNIKRDEDNYSKKIGNEKEYSGNNFYYGYDEFDSKSTPFYVNETEMINLNIQWLNETENEYFKDLLTSPILFIKKNGDLYFKSISLKSSNFKINKVDNEFNYSYDLNVEVNNKNITNW